MAPMRSASALNCRSDKVILPRFYFVVECDKFENFSEKPLQFS